MPDQNKDAWKTFTEEIEVSGQQLLSEINRLIQEGNVRRLQIKSADGDVFLAVPLTAGAVAGGLVAISAPWLAVVAALAGLVAKVKLEIVRSVPDTPPADDSDSAAADDRENARAPD